MNKPWMDAMELWQESMARDARGIALLASFPNVPGAKSYYPHVYWVGNKMMEVTLEPDAELAPALAAVREWVGTTEPAKKEFSAYNGRVTMTLENSQTGRRVDLVTERGRVCEVEEYTEIDEKPREVVRYRLKDPKCLERVENGSLDPEPREVDALDG